MRAHRKTLFAAFVVLSSSLSSVEPAFAIGISRDTDLTLGTGIWGGNCDLVISPFEPYSHMYAPCNLEKVVDELSDIRDLIVGHNLTSYPLGWPRSSLLGKIWPLIPPPGVGPQVNSEYCATFGDRHGNLGPATMRFGHYQDPDQNLLYPGHETCKTAEPEVRAYYQLQCFGAWVAVFSVDDLIPGVHLSYRLESDPIFCWAVAVAGGT